MAQAIEEWYKQMPIITRTYLIAPIVTTIGCSRDLFVSLHMFFLARYCNLLEENSFRGRTADLFFMLLFGATFLTSTVLIGGMIPYLS
ncbi:hypothetical protein Pint_22304 [Pistacia integerrima]|uniref:Uncharacterized protein n=1 Tax=Pistacia integerrima TaxID=434235 RepID=A0ACC0YI06_9ROSI|nr:hypothetical protein Pint_22304 [Pistacia integerrima]